MRTSTAGSSEVYSGGFPNWTSFEVDQDMLIGQAVGELELIVQASHLDEWEGQVRFLPL